MALYTPEYQPTGDEVAVITTSKGTIRVQLAGKDAPIHVGNFVELARKGFYDNLKFHRYVPGFVIQGGCPNTRDLSPEDVAKSAGNPCTAGLGTGGPGLFHQGGVLHEPAQQPRGRRARHGALPEPRLGGLAVLLLPGRPAHARLGLHGVRPDDRRHGRHRTAARSSAT